MYSMYIAIAMYAIYIQCDMRILPVDGGEPALGISGSVVMIEY